MEFSFDTFRLVASTPDLTAEQAAREYADCVEFRMDLATEPAVALQEYDGELPLLLTNRAAWEGGEAEKAGRLDALEAAVAHEFAVAVDIELQSVTAGAADSLLAAARDAGVATVISVHNFDHTPPEEELLELIKQANAAGDVAKLAVTAESRADTLALLSATQSATEAGHTVATMAMGEIGRHTRAVAPIYGSRIGYAPVTVGQATAPGQYTLAALSELIDTLL
jgi:3-dehydroquinate dehydratase-1